MGSGNKEKRKLGGKRQASSTPPGKVSEAKVAFELEPDAERIFRESVANMDVRAAKREDDDFPPMPAPSKSRGPAEIDLHRMTVAEAIAAVDQKIAELLSGLPRGAEATLKVITGKGLHSGPGGGVLARDVHEYVKHRHAVQIAEIDESPAKATLGGVPLRGHFTVRLRKASP